MDVSALGGERYFLRDLWRITVT